MPVKINRRQAWSFLDGRFLVILIWKVFNRPQSNGLMFRQAFNTKIPICQRRIIVKCNRFGFTACRDTGSHYWKKQNSTCPWKNFLKNRGMKWKEKSRTATLLPSEATMTRLSSSWKQLSTCPWFASLSIGRPFLTLFTSLFPRQIRTPDPAHVLSPD